jgi:hypothetical protein
MALKVSQQIKKNFRNISNTQQWSLDTARYRSGDCSAQDFSQAECNPVSLSLLLICRLLDSGNGCHLF